MSGNAKRGWFKKFAESLDDLHDNLRDVIEMLLEDGEPALEPEFVGVQVVAVAG